MIHYSVYTPQPNNWIVILLTLAGCIFMFPYTVWLLVPKVPASGHPQPDPVSRPLLFLTTVALSLGTLSLIMLWIGLLGVSIRWEIAALSGAVISLVGVVLFRSRIRVAVEGIFRPVKLNQLTVLTFFLLAILAALVLVNATLFPLGIDDAVTIYGYWGKQIAVTGRLPTGNLYEAYPQLLQLLYAFTFQASGWINEYLAKFYPALLSLGMIGAAYVLGREVKDRVTGVFAAVLVAFSVNYAHWASVGYVDLPSGFFYTLSVVFLSREFRTKRWQDALLAGLMAGLAAWTKNSALLLLISVGLWFGSMVVIDRRLRLRPAFLFALGWLGVAGAWYLRNWIAAHVIVPPTGWTWAAQRSLINLIPYLNDSRYLPVGIAYTIGLIYSAWKVIRDRSRVDLFLLTFYLPFFGIWWVLFSYDSRFLFVVIAVIAVMGARFLREVVTPVVERSGILRLATAGLVILISLLPFWNAIDHKTELAKFRELDFSSNDVRHQIQIGARYEMGRFLSTLTVGSRILTQDLQLPFYPDGVTVIPGGFPTRDQLADYDYWVISPSDITPEWIINPTLYETGGYRLYDLVDLKKSLETIPRVK